MISSVTAVNGPPSPPRASYPPSCSTRADGTYAGLEVLLVAQHDHKSRFIGHHCLVADRTRERLLEEQLRELTQNAERHPNATTAAR